jgi:hypothetical protein
MVVMALLLCDSRSVPHSFWLNRLTLCSCALPGDPLADVWGAIHQQNATRFALSEEIDAVLTSQSYVLEVKGDPAPFASAAISFSNSAICSWSIRPLNERTTSPFPVL